MYIGMNVMLEFVVVTTARCNLSLDRSIIITGLDWWSGMVNLLKSFPNMFPALHALKFWGSRPENSPEQDSEF